MSTIRLYVEMESRYENNPLQLAVSKIGEAGGATLVDEPVSEDGMEADIAVVNSARKALSILKETEHTTVVIAYFGRDEREPATALAGNHPERVKAVPYVAVKEEKEAELVPVLLAMLGRPEAAKGVSQ